MSITWTASRVDNGTTCIDLTYSSPAASDLLIAFVGHKYPAATSVTPPSGWTTLISACGGLGASGVDSGCVTGTFLYKIAAGTESTAVENFTTGANVTLGILFGYRSTTGSWSLDSGRGYRTANANTQWTACCLTDIGLTADDYLFVGTAINSNVNTFSAEAASNTGVVMSDMIERGDDSTTQGQDMGCVYADASAISGATTGCPVFSMLSSGSSAAEPAGVSLFLRVREVTAAAGGMPMGVLQPIGIVW